MIGPPKLWEWLMSVAIPPGIGREDIVGGMAEEFQERLASEGESQAVRWYRRQAFGLAVRGLGRRFSTAPSQKQGGWDVASVGQDLRFAGRMLRKNPVFSLVAVVTLALGIGANIAIYTVVEAVLLEPLPFEEPEELAVLWMDNHELNQLGELVAPREFNDWRSMNATFEGMAGYWPTTGTIREDDGVSTRLRLVYTTENFFSLLGSEILLGRGFGPDDGPGSTTVLLLSEGFWHQRFGGDPSVIGSTITLEGGNSEGGPIEVIGVVRTAHKYPATADAWINMNWPQTIQGRGPGWMTVLGRLAEGQDLDAARQDMTAVAARIAQENPETNRGWTVGMRSLHEEVVGEARTALLVLLGATALILLIACANVANLLLSKAEVRAREIAVRVAFGAGRLRLVRQLITESLVLAGAGALAGLGLAHVGVQVLLSLLPGSLPRGDTVTIDGTILMVAVGTAMAVGVLFGLAPVVRLLRSDVHTSIRDGSRSVAGSRNSGLQRSLVVAQFAMALMLVVGANFLVTTLRNIQQVDPGFEAQGVLTAELDVPQAAIPEHTEVTDFYERFRQRLRDIPGVLSVGDASTLPLGEPLDYTRDVVFVGRDIESERNTVVHFRSVSPGFFESMETPLVSGRHFNSLDRNGNPGAVIINEAMAEAFFPGEDPVGELIGDVGQCFGPLGCVHVGSGITESEIIGVIGDMKYEGLRESAEPALYFSGLQSSLKRRTLTLRTAGDATAVIAQVRGALADLNPTLALTNVRAMEDFVEDATARDRFSALLLSLFGVIALTLASVGVYGVLAYMVAQRREELGIRMALGADSGHVRGMVLSDGMRLVGMGLGLGALAALAFSGFLASQLYGVSPRDPLLYATPLLTLLVVGLLASFVPAWRATTVDPAAAMHAE